MPDPASPRPLTPVLGGVVSVLAVVAVIILLMSRSDGDTTDLGARHPRTTAAAATEKDAPSGTSARRVLVDYRPGARAATADGLAVLVADPLPDGWTLTLAEYVADVRVWHLTAATGGGGTVDLWQAEADVVDLVAEHASGAVPGADVDLSGPGTGVWGSWSGGGVEAIATDLGSSSVVLVGAGPSDLAKVAELLLPVR